ncbi:TetR family transcriptional regulator [Empedobacter brevis]|uniref:TetR/AcrR family transcriptional regulator n=1 Tax=Empedobacter brevis TaxID=247 RepID=UPI00131F74F1|nr:TetR/AcrR family transcriptional regulator [Empedobacter brevis]QHC86183.1 TetR family transcriptional regulator [Empedobacter brevis]
MTKASTTRHTILQKAFELIYTKGYQTTSIDEIIATTKVTKGAFYYHFKTKDEMGLAIINEILKPTMKNDFIKPLQDAKNPIKEIYDMTKGLLLENPFLKLEYGCPAGNLTQEMAPWNVEFGKALAELILEWQQTIENSIKIAKENGKVRDSVDPSQVAYFIMSGYWGIRNFGKVYNNTDCYHSYLKELKIYLNSLV